MLGEKATWHGRARDRRLIAAAVAAVLLAAGTALATLGGDTASPGTGGRAFVPSVPGSEAVVWAVGDGADGSAAPSGWRG